MERLNSKWAIEFNEYSVDVLLIRTNQKTGEEYVTPKYYFPNLETALDGIIDRSLADCETLESVVDMIKDLKREIRVFLSKNSKK